MRHKLLITLLIGACIAPHDASALAGQYGVIYAVDAPWRLEPITAEQQDGKPLQYGAIPITVTFRQAINELGRQYGSAMRLATGAGSDIWVGRITGIRVRERTDIAHASDTQFTVKDLRDIERKRQLSSKEAEPQHEFCNPSSSNDCASEVYITDTDEWHALLWYTPRLPVLPGRNISLVVEVTTESGGGDRKSWGSSLVIHAGDAALPRFSSQWLYGDLHYHAQMTGNEGEYGYSYRNVVRSMGAMGLDFLFATEHASDGKQTLAEVEVVRCENINGPICSPVIDLNRPAKRTDIAGTRGTQFVLSNEFCKRDDKLVPCLHYKDTAARDLNASRFAAAKGLIYGPGGANQIALDDAKFGYGRMATAHILPQIYMGEEVDAMPEMTSAEQASGSIKYGDNLSYLWPDVAECIRKFGMDACKRLYSMPVSAHDHRRMIVKDQEGLFAELYQRSAVVYNTLNNLGVVPFPDRRNFAFPARQHMVYFPKDSGSNNALGWVSGNTGPWGGASKRLSSMLGEIEGQGFTFLAHPLVNKHPGGSGPDVVPYSEAALDTAWASPAVLGLEYWNETFTRKMPAKVSDVTWPSGLRQFVLTSAQGDQLFKGQLYEEPPWKWTGDVVNSDEMLYDSTFVWDKYLRKGLDPQQTQSLNWLPKNEPRKWFTAGGSDAHGDLNYRQFGEMCGNRWCVNEISDTAIARPRNLVLVTTPPSDVASNDNPKAKRYSNTQVLEAIRSGHFIATDGPALRIAVDRNRNHAIDAEDFQMGDTFNLYAGEQLPLIVEWLSTQEFGPLQGVDVYLGTRTSTFAPPKHGPLLPNVAKADRSLRLGEYLSAYGSYSPDPSKNGVLHLDLSKLSVEARMHGRALLYLAPQEFGIGQADELFYVRAFGRTPFSRDSNFVQDCPDSDMVGQNCGNRMAYTNPIWGRYKSSCQTPAHPAQPLQPSPGAAGLEGTISGVFTADPGVVARSFMDADDNGIPDVCERPLTDPCIVTLPARGHGELPGSPVTVLTDGSLPAQVRLSCQRVVPNVVTHVGTTSNGSLLTN